MGEQPQQREYTLFSFLQYLPIPEALRRPIPALSILDTKLEVAMGLDAQVGLKPNRSHLAKKNKVRKRILSKKGPAGAMVCTGEVRQGQAAAFAIGDEQFVITEATWIFGEVRIGSIVHLTAIRRPDGLLEATKIIVS